MTAHTLLRSALQYYADRARTFDRSLTSVLSKAASWPTACILGPSTLYRLVETVYTSLVCAALNLMNLFNPLVFPESLVSLWNFAWNCFRPALIPEFTSMHILLWYWIGIIGLNKYFTQWLLNYFKGNERKVHDLVTKNLCLCIWWTWPTQELEATTAFTRY